MPLHPVALELLKETGPLAVSSANRTGSPPATTAAEAQEQLGDAVSVYLDGGPCANDVAVHDRGPDRERAAAAAGGRRVRRAAARGGGLLSTGGDVAPSA